MQQESTEVRSTCESVSSWHTAQAPRDSGFHLSREGNNGHVALGTSKLSPQRGAVPGATTPVPAGGTHWMCHRQNLGASRVLPVLGMPRHCFDLFPQASERLQLPRNWLLGCAQTPLSRWCSCPHPVQDQHAPLCRIGTLCGISFWEHYWFYSLAWDLQGRFVKA